MASAQRPPLNPPVKVRVGANLASSAAPLWVAIERGYFKDEGLDIQIVRFQNTIDTVPVLTAGELDASGIPPDPGFFNAVDRGVGVKIVGYYSTTVPNNKGLVVMVRQDLIDSGKYKSPKDLKGGQVGVTNTTGSSVYYVQKPVSYTHLTLPTILRV